LGTDSPPDDNAVSSFIKRAGQTSPTKDASHLLTDRLSMMRSQNIVDDRQVLHDQQLMFGDPLCRRLCGRRQNWRSG
jgi:hypothetical protein